MQQQIYPQLELHSSTIHIHIFRGYWPKMILMLLLFVTLTLFFNLKSYTQMLGQGQLLPSLAG